MAIEDAINRLASAVERSQANSAVAEIIRQRDAALKEAQQNKNSVEMYSRWYDQSQESLHKMERRVAALKAVITKMKRAKEVR